MADLKDILNNSNKDIDNQKLMEYLSGDLDAAARHELEAEMNDAEMLSDALEGLQLVDNKKSLELTVFELNQKLQKQLQLKKKKRDKRKIQGFSLTIIAIALILLLCIIAFVIIKMSATT